MTNLRILLSVAVVALGSREASFRALQPLHSNQNYFNWRPSDDVAMVSSVIGAVDDDKGAGAKAPVENLEQHETGMVAIKSVTANAASNTANAASDTANAASDMATTASAGHNKYLAEIASLLPGISWQKVPEPKPNVAPASKASTSPGNTYLSSLGVSARSSKMEPHNLLATFSWGDAGKTVQASQDASVPTVQRQRPNDKEALVSSFVGAIYDIKNDEGQDPGQNVPQHKTQMVTIKSGTTNMASGAATTASASSNKYLGDIASLIPARKAKAAAAAPTPQGSGSQENAYLNSLGVSTGSSKREKPNLLDSFSWN